MYPNNIYKYHKQVYRSIFLNYVGLIFEYLRLLSIKYTIDNFNIKNQIQYILDHVLIISHLILTYSCMQEFLSAIVRRRFTRVAKTVRFNRFLVEYFCSCYIYYTILCRRIIYNNILYIIRFCVWHDVYRVVFLCPVVNNACFCLYELRSLSRVCLCIRKRRRVYLIVFFLFVSPSVLTTAREVQQ